MSSFYKSVFKNAYFYGYLKIIFRPNKFPVYNFVRNLSLCNLSNNFKFNSYPKKTFSNNVILFSSLLTWLGLSKEDEDKESELIMTIKRSILLMQRGELIKAEQMLHVALRLAQNQGNANGITYVYDLMANLALERSQFDKAEKLFVNVLQRLLVTGISEDDIKVIHISLKLARISQMKNELDKAEIGFLWCLDSIKKHLNANDTNALTLYGVILDWYANFLSSKGNYKDCLKYLEEAYKIYSEENGTNTEKSVLLLNDLGTANWQTGNYDTAHEYLSRALSLGHKLDDFEHLGVIYANLGLVKLKQGILSEAKKYCKEGWSRGRKQNNLDAVNQANYCFEQIKTYQ